MSGLDERTLDVERDLVPHVDSLPPPPYDGLRSRPMTIVRRDDNAYNGGRKGGAQGGRIKEYADT